MNEIEKMYELAGVELFYRFCIGCPYYESGECPPRCPITSFTAEKQFELIKWLSQYCITIDCEDGEYEVYTGLDDNIIDNFYDKLEDAIAYCVNKIWQSLTTEKKQQVREILSD